MAARLSVIQTGWSSRLARKTSCSHNPTISGPHRPSAGMGGGGGAEWTGGSLRAARSGGESWGGRTSVLLKEEPSNPSERIQSEGRERSPDVETMNLEMQNVSV